LQTQALYGLPLDQPGTPESWLPLMEKVSREVAAGFAARGIHLEAYNTRESADDIEDVRRALGYERITLWGRSYGSHLALAVLRRHPKSIERVILANPEGPNDTLKLPSRVDAVLERYEARSPGLIASMRKVLDRLEREPQLVQVQDSRVVIGRFDVQLLTAQALGDPRTAATLPVAYREMEAGDFRRVAKLVVMLRSRMGVQSAMKQMMDLSSGATAERRARIEREAASSLLGNAINFPLMSLGKAWGNPDLGDDFRRPVRSRVPVLVLAGDLDPRTPVENGREIVAHLENGRLEVIAGGGHHFDLFGSAEVREMIGRFLRPVDALEQHSRAVCVLSRAVAVAPSSVAGGSRLRNDRGERDGVDAHPHIATFPDGTDRRRSGQRRDRRDVRTELGERLLRIPCRSSRYRSAVVDELFDIMHFSPVRDSSARFHGSPQTLSRSGEDSPTRVHGGVDAIRGHRSNVDHSTLFDAGHDRSLSGKVADRLHDPSIGYRHGREMRCDDLDLQAISLRTFSPRSVDDQALTIGNSHP
jgi:pimeloyl-ACP methyl ester carboxylesterase